MHGRDSASFVAPQPQSFKVIRRAGHSSGFATCCFSHHWGSTLYRGLGGFLGFAQLLVELFSVSLLDGLRTCDFGVWSLCSSNPCHSESQSKMVGAVVAD
jgi:hypothetical protein